MLVGSLLKHPIRAADAGAMGRTAVFVSVLALLVAAPAHAAAPATTPPGDEASAKQREEVVWDLMRKGPQRKEVQEAVRRGDFSDLEEKLETLQQGYEAGKVNERFVFQAFNALGKADLQPNIERWATEHPHAWPALAARGVMRLADAYRARGNKLVSETPPQQLNQMETYVDLAAGDIHAVLAERPRFLPAYTWLIDIARLLGDDAAGHAAMEASLHQDLNSFLVRDAYMGRLQPRWGGSWEAMDAFAREAQVHATANPELIALLGYSAADRAYDQVLAKNWRAAAELYTHALRFNRNPAWLRDRAKAYIGLGECPEAVADLNEALHYEHPNDPAILGGDPVCINGIGQRDASPRDHAPPAAIPH